uniref:urokinase plasminogen activator surface receptor-like n=1 Tax=Pristiophorus japonicus TaxID=55135 RepID=UPI00398E67F8
MPWGKEETFFAIFTFCMMLAEVRPLTCYQCTAPSGHCDPQEVICLSAITTCRTISTTQVTERVSSSRIINSCGSCSDPLSFSTGVVSISQASTCCDSDLCNKQTVAEPPNTTQNGMECRGCFSSSSTSCSDNEQTVKCVGPETRCMNVSGKQAVLPKTGSFFARGCASEQICQSTSALREFLILADENPKCCTENLCNTDVARPKPVRPLTCYQCTAPSGHCDPQQVTCPSTITTCRTISTTQVTEGVSSSRIINSCGSCSDPLSFSTGVVSISQASTCCDSDLCNKQTVAEPPNTTQNGMECRGCFNSSSTSCSDNEQTVKCVGPETRCMNVSGKQAVLPKTGSFFARGCASEQICQSTSALREFNIQANEIPNCCTGNLCNTDVARPKPASLGCILGSIFGAVAGILILLVICCFCCRKNRDAGSGVV